MTDKINQLADLLKQADTLAAEINKDADVKSPHKSAVRTRISAALDSLALVEADLAAKP
jgi:hypothetical protein